jgi:hypothetical protein
MRARADDREAPARDRGYCAAAQRKEERERCLPAGMDAFLAKPIDASALWAAIEKLEASKERDSACSTGVSSCPRVETTPSFSIGARSNRNQKSARGGCPPNGRHLTHGSALVHTYGRVPQHEKGAFRESQTAFAGCDNIYFGRPLHSATP